MQVLEKTIEQAFVRRMKKIRVTALKLTPDGQTGWPDRLVLIPGGRPLFIEFKRPGEVPRKKQAVVQAELDALGYDVKVFDDVDKAVYAVINAMHQAARRRG